MTRTFALVALVVVAGCSGSGLVPGRHGDASAAHGRSASDAATAAPGDAANAMPGDAANAMPGDAANAMPGDAANAMPGDAANAMPGAQLACAPASQAGIASCTLAVNVNVKPIADPALAPPLVPGLHPADLDSAYALPSQNAGGTVAIVDAYDDPAAEADLGVYRTAFGLPACTTANGCFRKVNQRGAGAAYPAPNAGWSQEIALDLAMVSAVCPRCSIVLVETDSSLVDDLGAGVDTAARLGAVAISNSYYTGEWANEPAEDVHFRHAGIAITAAAGDSPKPSYPAASQYVTAVGGTSLSNNGGTWTEKAWTYGGRGCSAYVLRPAWQARNRCSSGRSTVDVAAVADPQTGVAFFDTQAGGWLVAGGTSVGAPIVAASYALSGIPAGPAYSYAHMTGFHPVGPYRYNQVTGLGSPNGVAGL